jgi:transcription initiation factor TFIID subunit 1
MLRSGNKYIIREIPVAYTVGQIQPLVEVPAPNSREANQFIKNRIQAYIYRTFRQQQLEKKEPCITIVNVARAFPGQSDNSIRKQLKVHPHPHIHTHTHTHTHTLNTLNTH